MRGRFSTQFAVALLVLSATVALAQAPFSDFPISGQISAFPVNLGSSTSDSFTLTSSATITQVAFGAWVYASDSVTGVTWAIGTSPYDTSLGSGTATTTSVYDFTNVDSFDVHTVTFSIPTTNLPAGTYYLTLSSAVSAENPTANPVYWDINDATGVDAWNSSYGHVSAAGSCFALIGISGSCAESFQLLSSAGSPTASLTSLVVFPNTVEKTTATALSATLSNTGTGSLTSIVPTITGANPDDFAITTGTNACGASLAAGASCNFYVTFTPSIAAGFSATLSVADSATGSPQTSTLLGTGTAPINSVSLTSLVVFPNTTAHTTSAALAATLTNTGSNTVTGIAPSIGGANPDDFAISTGTNACGASLAAGASCNIYITFTPSIAAGFSATLSVADSATGSPQTSTLLGTGIPPAGTVSLTSLVVFPNTTAKTTSAAQIATLTNNSASTVTGIAPSIGGANPDDFAITTGTNACGASLAAGASCNYYITFTPSLATGFSATLSVADSATGSPQTSTLLGTGN